MKVSVPKTMSPQAASRRFTYMHLISITSPYSEKGLLDYKSLDSSQVCVWVSGTVRQVPLQTSVGGGRRGGGERERVEGGGCVCMPRALVKTRGIGHTYMTALSSSVQCLRSWSAA